MVFAVPAQLSGSGGNDDGTRRGGRSVDDRPLGSALRPDGALRTIAGYEATNMIRKGQIRWLAKGDVVEQIRFIHQVYGIAA